MGLPPAPAGSPSDVLPKASSPPQAKPPAQKLFEPTVPATPGPGPSTLRTQQQSGLISIWVPAQARVIINGLETRSTGQYREYVSNGLKPGFTYKYEIRARLVRDGRLIEETRTVHLTAGARKAVAFRFSPEPERSIATLW